MIGCWCIKKWIDDENDIFYILTVWTRTLNTCYTNYICNKLCLSYVCPSYSLPNWQLTKTRPQLMERARSMKLAHSSKNWEMLAFGISCHIIWLSLFFHKTVARKSTKSVHVTFCEGINPKSYFLHSHSPCESPSYQHSLKRTMVELNILYISINDDVILGGRQYQYECEAYQCSRAWPFIRQFCLANMLFYPFQLFNFKRIWARKTVKLENENLFAMIYKIPKLVSNMKSDQNYNL